MTGTKPDDISIIVVVGTNKELDLWRAPEGADNCRGTRIPVEQMTTETLGITVNTIVRKFIEALKR